MKRFRLGMLVLTFLLMATIGFAANYSWNSEFGASLGRDTRSWNNLYLKNSVIFEGLTSDAYETTLTVAEPTADRTITLPDYTGAIPLVIAQSATTTAKAGVASGDVTGSSLTLASGWMTAGKTLKWTVAGSKTSDNAAMKIYLYLKDAVVMTLTASDVSGVDWVANFTLYEYTDTAHQKIVGCLNRNGKVTDCDYAVATKDVSGSTVAKVIIESQHASDTVTAEYVLIEHWVK